MSLAALSPDALRSAASQVTALLAVLANENRLMLLCQLSQGEHCVQELETRLDLHQPTLSQQLGVLRTHGLVQTRRDGKRIYYRIAEPRALALMAELQRLYCPARECV